MDPYVGEIRLFAFKYAPQGWALCNGQLLQISSYPVLYSILSTKYGGDGKKTFALPDLRDKVPICTSSKIEIGKSYGEATHTLTLQEIPQHTHTVSASSTDGQSRDSAGNFWAKTAVNPYESTASITMSPSALSVAGLSQAHSNMQPYLSLNYCICTVGLYPSHS